MKSEKEEKSFNHQILLEANYNDMLQNLDTERMNENWELTLLLQCGAVNANEVKDRLAAIKENYNKKKKKILEQITLINLVNSDSDSEVMSNKQSSTTTLSSTTPSTTTTSITSNPMNNKRKFNVPDNTYKLRSTNKSNNSGKAARFEEKRKQEYDDSIVEVENSSDYSASSDNYSSEVEDFE